MKEQKIVMTNASLDVPILSAGRWVGIEWSDATMDALTANFARLKTFGEEVPFTAGHASAREQAPLGWVDSLRRVGSGKDAQLVARVVDLTPEAQRDIEAGVYRKVSVGLIERWQDTEAASNGIGRDVKGFMLDHLAALASGRPRIRGLASLPRHLDRTTLAAGAAGDEGYATRCIETPLAAPASDLLARVGALEAGVAAAARLRADLERRITKLTTPDTGRSDAVILRLKETNNMPENTTAPDDAASWKPVIPQSPGAVAALRSFLDDVLRQLRIVGGDPKNRSDRLDAVRTVSATWRSTRPDDFEQLTPQALDQLANDNLVAGSTSMLHASEKHAGAPLYGFAAIEAERLAPGDEGIRRYHRVRQIAKEHAPPLSLTRTADRAKAERILFDEMNRSVSQALSFDEAVAAVLRDGKTTFAETQRTPDRIREASLRAARLRPDLAGAQYVSTRKGADAKVAFTEATADEWDREPAAIMAEERVGRSEAARLMVKRNPALMPAYGRTGAR